MRSSLGKAWGLDLVIRLYDNDHGILLHLKTIPCQAEGVAAGAPRILCEAHWAESMNPNAKDLLTRSDFARSFELSILQYILVYDSIL